MWTCSLESADSASQYKPAASEPSSCARLIPSAVPGLKALGRESPLSPTLEPAISRPGAGHGCLRQAFLANPYPAPGSGEARQMTAGSGRRLSVYLPKSGPLGRCLRMCLASNTWASTEYLLTWKARATKSGYLIFRLAASTPRTGGRGYGSWPTDTKGQTQNPDRADVVPNIVKATWPTPQNGMTEKAHGQVSGQYRSAVQAAWPTPDASKAGKTSRSGERKGEPLIGGLTRATWPTPKSVLSGPDFAKTERGKLPGGSTSPSLSTVASGIPSSGCLARTGSFVERLTTLSAWLMGYPESYLRYWAIPSSRKSPRKS